MREAEQRMNNLQKLKEERGKLEKETEEIEKETRATSKGLEDVEKLSKKVQEEVQEQVQKIKQYGKYSTDVEKNRQDVLNEIEALNREMKLVEKLASRRGGRQMFMHRLSHLVPKAPKISIPKINIGYKGKSAKSRYAEKKADETKKIIIPKLKKKISAAMPKKKKGKK